MKALPIGNFYFFSKAFNELSEGNKYTIGMMATKKKVPIMKNGTEYPNIQFKIEPIHGPNNKPRLFIYLIIYAVIDSMIANFFWN